MALVYLLFSALVVNGVHAYLLYSQRTSRKWSISTHAKETYQTHALYLAGHFVGGLLFLIFAKLFFYDQLDSAWLFWLTFAGVICEWLQAVIPDRGKYSLWHNIFAFSMASFITFIIILSIFLLDISALSIILLAIILAILGYGFYFGFTKYGHKSTWMLQYFNTVLSYIAVIAIYLGV